MGLHRMPFDRGVCGPAQATGGMDAAGRFETPRAVSSIVSQPQIGNVRQGRDSLLNAQAHFGSIAPGKD
jgi:hypothetical protein